MCFTPSHMAYWKFHDTKKHKMSNKIYLTRSFLKELTKKGFFKVYFRLKLIPTSGRCPGSPIFFFKNLFYQNSCKEAMIIEGGQIKGALFNFFVEKKCPFLYLLDAALSF